jgi:hypothetical protein
MAADKKNGLKLYKLYAFNFIRPIKSVNKVHIYKGLDLVDYLYPKEPFMLIGSYRGFLKILTPRGLTGTWTPSKKYHEIIAA